MDPRQYTPPPPRAQSNDNLVMRYSILGVVALCTLISGLLGDSLIGVYRIDEGELIPRGWRWLLGASEQTFGTQSFALLSGVVLLGFAFGGVWFLAQMGIRYIRSQLGSSGFLHRS
jgi:hypothetical protein